MGYINNKLFTKCQSFMLLLLFMAISFAVSSCSGGGGESSSSNSNMTLQSIEVTQVSPTTHLGINVQFTATGKYLDSSKKVVLKDITTEAKWSSSNTTVATVSNSPGSQGLVTPKSQGTSTITATLDGITSPDNSLEVVSGNLTSITVTPSNSTTHLGIDVQFTATGIYSDETKQDITTSVEWSSSDTTKVTISNANGSKGLAAPAAVGKSSISASLDGIQSAATDLQVDAAILQSIQISSLHTNVPLGISSQFTAVGVYSDKSTQPITDSITWSSSKHSTATIDSKGLATPVAVGDTNISASMSGITSNIVALTVNNAVLESIEVTSLVTSTPIGVDVVYTATGIYSDSSTPNITSKVTWDSSDSTKATISNASNSYGIATPVEVGHTNISASWDGITSNALGLNVTAAQLTSVVITSVTTTTPLGVAVQFTAKGTYTDGTDPDVTSQAIWSSSDDTKATISNANGSNGLATPAAVGSTNISASFGGLTSNTIALAVTAAQLESVTITSSITTTPLGVDVQFTAKGSYTDGTKPDLTSQATWFSADPSIAAISNDPGSNGLAIPIALGNTNINASFDGVTSNTINLTVSQAELLSIEVSTAKTITSIGGANVQFTAIGTYTNGSYDITSQVLWASSNELVAPIGNASGSNGLAVPIAVGTSNISASYSGVDSNSIQLTVVAAPAITGYSIESYTGIIDNNIITVTVPYNLPVTLLAADFTSSVGSNVTVNGVTQTTGVTQNDFSAPVTYLVTAADGTTATYVVSVIQAASFTWMSGSNQTGQAGVYGIQGMADPANIPGARDQSTSWTDANGNLWLFGGVYFNPGAIYFNDLWKYSPATNQWTWVKGSNLTNQAGVYGTQGVPDPANMPGARYGAASWTDASGNFWLFGGFGYSNNTTAAGYLSDLWKYDIITNQWTWVSGLTLVTLQAGVYGIKGTADSANLPGARQSAAAWTDHNGNLWLFGGAGYGNTTTAGWLNDLWKYDSLANQWTWMSGESIISQPGVYGTRGTGASTNVPGSRAYIVSWLDTNGNLWLFGGRGYGNTTASLSYLNDLWVYDLVTNQWTWVSGSQVTRQSGVYGTQGMTGVANVPGSRYGTASFTDNSGNLWLFGGTGFDGSGNSGALNDLWRFSPSTFQWTWIGGANIVNQAGTYGTQGVVSPLTVPGSRSYPASWTDLNGNFWLFGGQNYLGNGNNSQNFLNDLWQIQPR